MTISTIKTGTLLFALFMLFVIEVMVLLGYKSILWILNIIFYVILCLICQMIRTEYWIGILIKSCVRGKFKNNIHDMVTSRKYISINHGYSEFKTILKQLFSSKPVKLINDRIVFLLDQKLRYIPGYSHTIVNRLHLSIDAQSKDERI